MIKLKNKREKGVTLIALAVTVTVMLIIGSVSINAMFGENGVLKKAKEQGNKTKETISESEAKTNQLVQDYENMMAGVIGNEVDGTSQEIVDNLKQQIEELKKQNDELKKSQATGDATEEQVISGATFSTSKGVGMTGTMPSYTNGIQSVTTSEKWGINTTHGAWMNMPNNGYYSTSYMLNIPWNTIKGSMGNASASQVLNGATFTSTNGINVVGAMPSYTSGNQSVTTTGKWGFTTTYGAWMYMPNNGYYSTSHWVNIPWNTIKGSMGNANSSQVVSGTTFSSANGINVTGTMPSYTSGNQSVTASGKWGFDKTYGAWMYIPNNGYYSTSHWLNIPYNTIKEKLYSSTVDIKTATYNVTSSSDSITFYNGSGGTVKKYYATLSLGGDKRVISIYYARSDISSGGYDYNIVGGNGQCAWMNTSYFFNLAHGSSNWNCDIRLALPVRAASKPYSITIWYI